MTHAGAMGFWPMGLDDSNPYVRPPCICQLAITEWACAVTQGREDGEYHYKEPNPRKDYGEPKWPAELTLGGMLAQLSLATVRS